MTVIFSMCNFLFDVDQNAQISLLTKLSLMQFSCTKIGSSPDNFMSLNKMCNSYTLRWATFQAILCLVMSYAVFTLR